MSELFIYLNILLIAISGHSELLLLDESDILSELNGKLGFDFVYSVPYDGSIYISNSNLDRLQIIVNYTYPNDKPIRLDHFVTVQNDTNPEVYIQLTESQLVQREVDYVAEDLIYIQLLFITLSSLILVVLVFSIIFSCWWIKSRNRHDEMEKMKAFSITHKLEGSCNEKSTESENLLGYDGSAASTNIASSDISQMLSGYNKSLGKAMETTNHSSTLCRRPSVTSVTNESSSSLIGTHQLYRPMGNASTLGRRHIAPEFLDENLFKISKESSAKNSELINLQEMHEPSLNTMDESNLLSTNAVMKPSMLSNIPMYMTLAPSNAVASNAIDVQSNELQPTFCFIHQPEDNSQYSKSSPVPIAVVVSSQNEFNEMNENTQQNSCPQHPTVLQAATEVKEEVESKKFVPQPPERVVSLQNRSDKRFTESQTLSRIRPADPLEREKADGDEDQEPEDGRNGYATLPSSLKSPKSVLKDSSKSNGVLLANGGNNNKINKQLRFTTLSIMCLIGLATTLTQPVNGMFQKWHLSFKVDPKPMTGFNMILSPNQRKYDLEKLKSLFQREKSHLFNNTERVIVDVNILLPERFKLANRNRLKRNISAYSSQENLIIKVDDSSNVFIGLDEDIDRESVQIYDVSLKNSSVTLKQCKQRYGCEHSCDNSPRHACICQRGYTMKNQKCVDFHECSLKTVSDECIRRGGKCIEKNGSYECLCNGNKTCLPCDTECPKGYYRVGDCSLGKQIKCNKCSDSCPKNQFILNECSKESDIICSDCAPSCVSDDFEFVPCKGRHNRVCKTKSLIPEMSVPFKKNVIYENLMKVHEPTVTIDNKSFFNKEYTLDRNTGFHIKIKIKELNLAPIFKPVDHNNSNDNQAFIKFYNKMMDGSLNSDSWHSMNRPTALSTSYDYRNRDDYESFFNKKCPYPLPMNYKLKTKVLKDVLTSVIAEPNWPGYRSEPRPCNASSYSYDKRNSNEAVISCFEPSKFTELFLPYISERLAQRKLKYIEEKTTCKHLKKTCIDCLDSCGRSSNNTSLMCQTQMKGLDNSATCNPLTAACYDCCTREQCDTSCKRYPAQRCHMKLCSQGDQVDFHLVPQWPEDRNYFSCHMEPDEKYPIYSFEWSIQHNGSGVQTFQGSFILKKRKENDEILFDKVFLDSDDIKSEIFNDLLRVEYSSGLSKIPEIISGNNETFTANLWNFQKKDFKYRPNQEFTIWPKYPHKVNTDVWNKRNDQRCSLNEELIDDLIIDDNSGSPYEPLTQIYVERHPGSENKFLVYNKNQLPKVVFTVLRDKSVIGALVGRTSVERDTGIYASMALIAKQDGSTFWMIDVTGEIRRNIGYFRIQLLQDNQTFIDASTSQNDISYYYQNELLLDYEIGVFEEKRFQIRFEVPAPGFEPDYEQVFRIRIIDDLNMNNRLEIKVRRKPQTYEDMQIRRDITNPFRNPSSKIKRKSGSRNLNDIIIGPTVYGVVIVFGSLITLSVLMCFGYLVERDPSKLWINKEVSKPTNNPDEDAKRLINSITIQCLKRGQKGSKWKRVVLLIGYLSLKATYSFGFSLTTLVVLMRFITRDVTSDLFNMNNSPVQHLIQNDTINFIQPFIDFIRSPNDDVGANANSAFFFLSQESRNVRDRLFQQQMEIYLRDELMNQRSKTLQIVDSCERGLDQMFASLENKLHLLSKQAAERRSKVLISEAIAELTRGAASYNINKLLSDLRDFNKTLHYVSISIKADINSTIETLEGSQWLKGAKRVYEEIKEPNKKPFLQWANIINEEVLKSANSLNLQLPTISSPFNPLKSLILDKLESRRTDSNEISYGPEYIPFESSSSDKAVDFGSFIINEEDTSTMNKALKKPILGQQRSGKGSERLSSIYQDKMINITWVHILCSALILDGLWLIHRVLHTVDTAEKILYGIPVTVDFTKRGLYEAFQGRSRIISSLNRLLFTITKTSSVRQISLTVISLIAIISVGGQANKLLTHQVFQNVGFYDQYLIPMSEQAKKVNTIIIKNAERLTSQEIGLVEATVNRRYKDAQSILNNWSKMLYTLERKQCQMFTMYKYAAKRERLKNNIDFKNRADFDEKFFFQSESDGLPIPSHCRMTNRAVELEMETMQNLFPPNCPIDAIVGNLFKEYNSTEYYQELTSQSQNWLLSARKWASKVINCIFIFISSICLWNAFSSVIWFYLRWIGVLPRKIYYESDIQDWLNSNNPQKNGNSQNNAQNFIN